MCFQVFLSFSVGDFLFRCFYFLELECIIASWYPQALAVPSVAFEPRFRGSFRWHLLLPPRFTCENIDHSMFSAFNPIFQVVGVHPGRGGEGASNDGLQGLDILFFSIIGIQCNAMFGLGWSCLGWHPFFLWPNIKWEKRQYYSHSLKHWVVFLCKVKHFLGEDNLERVFLKGFLNFFF